MNEHTKLLIMKAGGIICSTEATGHIDKIDYLHFDAEKFAELIVLECAKCMTTPQIQAKWPDDVVMKTVLDVLVSDMKEHFGIKD